MVWVFLSPPHISKSWPDSVCAVSASKPVLQSGAPWRPVAAFQFTSGAVDLKIAFIYWLLYVPTVAQITTLLSQDNRACVDLCCSNASGKSVHFNTKFIQDTECLKAYVCECVCFCVCLWESKDSDGMFVQQKSILQWVNVYVLWLEDI